MTGLAKDERREICMNLEKTLTDIMESISNLYASDTKILEILNQMSTFIGLQQEIIEQLQAKIAELEGKISSGE